MLFLSACTSRTTIGLEPGSGEYAPHLYSFPKAKVYEKAILAAGALEWQVGHTDAASGVIAAEVGASMMTWGDKVSILVSEIAPTETRVDVTTGTSGQLVDWGKSRVNIRTFYEKLTQLLGAAPTPVANAAL